MSIISVEGNLGAGKSTLLGLLNAEVIKEPVDEWENTAGKNILQRYYNDPKRWAFTFQLNALHSRSMLWEEAIRNNKDSGKVMFSERSPLADRYIFGEIMQREGNFEEAEYAVYDSLCRSIIGNLPVKGIIYLRCSPELCLERIQKRNRKGEEGISLEYIKKVHERHEAWISRQQEECEVLVIDMESLDLETESDQKQ